MTNSHPGRGAVRRLGLAAAAVLTLAAVSHDRAEAFSLASPGTAPSAKYASDGLATEVRHGGGGHHGGGGFHGGVFRGGGAAFHGGGFRGGGAALHGHAIRSGGMVFRGGGYRASPVFHGGYRAFHRPHAFHHRHHFHRRIYYAPSYTYYPRRHCRIVWTHYGPRKICRHRPWYRHHYRHRWHHHRYW
jgi:hypothetical protein